MPRKLKRTLPGDRADDIASMIRVDHAGEYGAKRIYQGQMDVLGKNPKLKRLIGHMAAQEEVHLGFFEKEIAVRQVRPSALHPLWHAAGYALGAITAKMGAEAAMACTVAVEEVISEHYAEQLDALKKNKSEKKLHAAIRKFKAEEEEHHDIGLEHDAETAPAYPLLTKAIKAGARIAIAVAKRI
ncbi:MAG: demethoxyubiquinone hydroxylase family protein [Alphaproteobacteria bacterium]|nr:demethoxyubiquinone hydroxylase family protein [Alphaproteobacteria bacterium]